MILVEAPKLPQDRQQFVSEFCDHTGYGRSELLAYSTQTGMFLTRNGGKYRLADGEIKHIAGPSPDPEERF